jgi:hypothetical protein
MSMRSTIAKGTAYALAPRTTFAVRHPRKAAVAMAAGMANRLSPARRRRARTRTALKGLGAAAVALPVGLWLGRKMWPAQDDSSSMAGTV